MGGVELMRKSSGVPTAASVRGRAARPSSPFSLIGATAIAGVVLACAGTLYANVFAAGAFPSVGGFDDRFAAVAAPAKPADARQPMALAMLTPPTAPAPLVSSDAPTGSLGGDFAERFAPSSPSSAPAVGLSREEFAARFAPPLQFGRAGAGTGSDRQGRRRAGVPPGRRRWFRCPISVRPTRPRCRPPAPATRAPRCARSPRPTSRPRSPPPTPPARPPASSKSCSASPSRSARYWPLPRPMAACRATAVPPCRRPAAATTA